MKKQTEPAVQSQPSYERQRRFPRHHLDVRIQVLVFRDGRTSTLWGRTSEVGADGVGATLTGELRPGEVVSIEFPIPVAPHVIQVRGIVRYSQGLHCGFEFLALADAQRDALMRVCGMLGRAF